MSTEPNPDGNGNGPADQEVPQSTGTPPELPTTDSLAALAAAMLGPDEAPERAASRALQLWHACREELEHAAHLELNPQSQGYRSSVEKFLAKVGLNRFDAERQTGHEKLVPISEFLAAVMPDSKADTRKSKWQAFWEQETANPDRKNPAWQSSYDSFRMPADPEAPIGAWSILTCRDVFLKRVQKAVAANQQHKGKIGPRMKDVYRVMRAVDGRQKLSKKDTEILKSITPNECDAAAANEVVLPAGMRRVRAAIESANTPTSERPRTILAHPPE